METKGIKIAPDKSYFTQAVGGGPGIKESENSGPKHALSVSPKLETTIQKYLESIPTENSLNKGSVPPSSFVKKQQKRLTALKERNQRRLVEKKISSTSQGSLNKKIKAQIQNSNAIKNISSAAESNVQIRRWSGPEDTLRREVKQFLEGASRSTSSIVKSRATGQRTQSSSKLLSPSTELRIVKSAKVSSAFRPPHELALNRSPMVPATRVFTPKTSPLSLPNSSKPIDTLQPKTVKLSTYQLEETKNTVQKLADPVVKSSEELQKDKEDTEQKLPVVKFDSKLNSYKFDRKAKAVTSVKPEENVKVENSFTLLAQAFDILLKNSFGTKQTQSKTSKPETQNVFRSPANDNATPAEGSLIERILSFGTGTPPSNQNFKVQPIQPSPVKDQSTIAEQDAKNDKHLKREVEAKNLTTNDSSLRRQQNQKLFAELKSSLQTDNMKNKLKRTNNSNKSGPGSNEDSRDQDLKHFSESDTQFYSVVEKEEKAEKPPSQKNRSKRLKFVQRHSSESDENTYLSSEYSGDSDHYYMSESYFSDETLSNMPEDSAVTRRRSPRYAEPRDNKRYKHSSHTRRSYPPHYGYSGKLKHNKDDGLHKSYLKRIYTYTSDKIRKMVQPRPEQFYYARPEKRIQTQGVQTMYQDYHEYFPAQEALYSNFSPASKQVHYQRKFPVLTPSQNEEDYYENMLNKVDENYAKPSQTENLFQRQPKHESIHIGLQTENRISETAKSIRPNSLYMKHEKMLSPYVRQNSNDLGTQSDNFALTYEDKATFTDTEDQSVITPSIKRKTRFTEIQTQTDDESSKKSKTEIAVNTSNHEVKCGGPTTKAWKDDDSSMLSDESRSVKTSVNSVHYHDKKHQETRKKSQTDTYQSSLKDEAAITPNKDGVLKKLYQLLPGVARKVTETTEANDLSSKKRTNRQHHDESKQKKKEKGKTLSLISSNSRLSDVSLSDNIYSEISDGDSSGFSFCSESTRRTLSIVKNTASMKGGKPLKRNLSKVDETLARGKQNTSVSIKTSSISNEAIKESGSDFGDFVEINSKAKTPNSTKHQKVYASKKHESNINSLAAIQLSNSVAKNESYHTTNEENVAGNSEQSQLKINKSNDYKKLALLEDAKVHNNVLSRAENDGQSDVMKHAKTQLQKELLEVFSENKGNFAKPETGILKSDYSAALKQLRDPSYQGFPKPLENTPLLDNRFRHSQWQAVRKEQNFDITPNKQKRTNMPFTNVPSDQSEKVLRGQPRSYESDPNQIFHSAQLRPSSWPSQEYFRQTDTGFPNNQTLLGKPILQNSFPVRPFNRQMMFNEGYQNTQFGSEGKIMSSPDMYSTALSLHHDWERNSQSGLPNDNQLRDLMNREVVTSQAINRGVMMNATSSDMLSTSDDVAMPPVVYSYLPILSEPNSQRNYFNQIPKLNSMQDGSRNVNENFLSDQGFENRMKYLYQQLPGNNMQALKNNSAQPQNNFSKSTPVAFIQQQKVPSTPNYGSMTSDPRISLSRYSSVRSQPNQLRTMNQKASPGYFTTGPQSYSPGISKIGPQSFKVGPPSNSNQMNTTQRFTPSKLSDGGFKVALSDQSRTVSLGFSPSSSRMGNLVHNTNQSKTGFLAHSSGFFGSASPVFSPAGVKPISQQAFSNQVKSDSQAFHPTHSSSASANALSTSIANFAEMSTSVHSTNVGQVVDLNQDKFSGEKNSLQFTHDNKNEEKVSNINGVKKFQYQDTENSDDDDDTETEETVRNTETKKLTSTPSVYAGLTI